jgi:hypothetical protein
MIPIYIRDILKATLFWGPPFAPSIFSFNLKHYCLQSKGNFIEFEYKMLELNSIISSAQDSRVL